VKLSKLAVNAGSSRRSLCGLVKLGVGLGLWLLGLTGWAQPQFYHVLHMFSGEDGAYPQSGLLLGSDNALYGSAQGADNAGKIFKMDRDGGGFQILHTLAGNPDGTGTIGALIQGANGALYGVTSDGGTNNAGTVFRLGINATSYRVLHHFAPDTDGSNPVAGLILGPDGTLYGTTSRGAPGNGGAIFRLNPDGTGFNVLHTFSNLLDGTNPVARLTLASDGLLYGTAAGGGAANGGTVFSINPVGSDYRVRHTFTNAPDGFTPQGHLTEASDGALYGTTVRGGERNYGAIFKLSLDDSAYLVVHSFTNGVDGALPRAGLTRGWDNALYGSTSFGGPTPGGTLFRMYPGGNGYSVVFSYTNANDGIRPIAELTQGPSSLAQGLEPGVMYGVTYQGGYGTLGTVFGLVLNPPLALTPLNNQSVLMWPAWAQHYVLQTSTNLADGPWINMTNGIPLIGLQLTNTTISSNAFFRLVWPQ